MRVVITSASCDAKFQRNFKSYVSLCNRLNTVYCLEWSRMELVDVAIHHLKGNVVLVCRDYWGGGVNTVIPVCYGIPWVKP